MTGLGFAEILVLALLSGGMNSTDLVALVEPVHYFKDRNIQSSVDRLIDIVIVDPATPKAQILQLTALRHLADDADAFKKAKNYATNRLAIEEIAAGKRGVDPAGFAQEYAHRVLAKLDGVKPAPAKHAPLRDDALSWFPANVHFAYALDLRPAHDTPNDTLKQMLKLMSNDAKRDMYAQLEKVGNYRIERIALGMVDAKNPDDRKMFARISGKGNPAWVADLLQTQSRGDLRSKKSKAADGTPILHLQSNRQGSDIMIIGSTDLVVFGYHKFDGKHEDVGAELLDVRAKKKPSAATGVLKDRLAKVPDKAIAFMIGDLSDEMRKDLNFISDAIPAKVFAHVERTPIGLDLKAEGAMANAEEAGKLVQKLATARKDAIKELQQAMKEPPFPGMMQVPYQSIIDLMDGLQLHNDGAKVHARGFVPNTLLQQLGQMSLQARSAYRDDFPKDFKK
jgi:hypothetical protein